MHRRSTGRGAQGGFDPQFAFGDGLSYTTFAHSDLRLAADTITPGESLQVEVTVKNTGDRIGEETVLLFTHQHYASLTPAERRLRGFRRVKLAPGQVRTVVFSLPAADLSYVGRDGRPVLEPGTFDVLVGGLKATFQLVDYRRPPTKPVAARRPAAGR